MGGLRLGYHAPTVSVAASVGGVSNVVVRKIGVCAASIEEESTMLNQTGAKEFNPKNIWLAKLLVDNDVKLKNANCLSLKYPP